MHTAEYSLATKKNDILPSATAKKYLEGIMPSEISQPEERQILYDFTYMWNLNNKRNKQTKEKYTHREQTEG